MTHNTTKNIILVKYIIILQTHYIQESVNNVHSTLHKSCLSTAITLLHLHVYVTLSWSCVHPDRSRHNGWLSLLQGC